MSCNMDYTCPSFNVDLTDQHQRLPLVVSFALEVDEMRRETPLTADIVQVVK